jgi:hypothetical protein
VSWVDEPELQIFLKESRLSGFEVLDHYARQSPYEAGVLVRKPGCLFRPSLCITQMPNGVWRTWKDVFVLVRYFETLEDALDDLEQRLRDLEE